MNQIQKQEYHKKPASKAESKKRRTREQLANLTKEERSFIYDRSFKSKLRKAKSRLISNSNSKEISFYFNLSMPTVTIPPNVYINIQASENLEPAQGMAKKFEAVTKRELQALRRTFSPKFPLGYIKAPPNFHKGERQQGYSSYNMVRPEPWPLIADGDQAFDNVMSEEEWFDFIETCGKRDADKLLESGLVTIAPSTKEKYMKHDEESQPNYSTKPAKHRSNVSAYKQWIPEERPTEKVDDVFAKMTPFINSPDWDRFVAIMGKEEALKWFEAGLKQATREN